MLTASSIQANVYVVLRCSDKHCGNDYPMISKSTRQNSSWLQKYPKFDSRKDLYVVATYA